ncbi:MAG TPA: hypothetical protein VMV98_03085, partial [Acidobacteriaceae bacterium]|nr:hypothetical protein [Acidobacteriaceae bacterium]
DALLQTNQSTADTSYHLTGSIHVAGYPPAPLDLWASAGSTLAAPMAAALLAGDRFSQLYSNSTRMGSIRSIDLDVTAVPRRVDEQLENARLISGDSAHAGDTVVVEATVRPWQQPAHNIRIPIKLPARLDEGTVRLLVSDAGTLDRTLNPPRLFSRPPDMDAALSLARALHRDDRIYVSLLLPDAQADVSGETLASLPLSMANALEPLRTTRDATLNGESAVVAGDAPAGGVLSGFQVLNLHIEAGGGLE